MDSAGNSAWPEAFPIEKIQKMRETVGDRHFSAQMMLEYVSPDKIRLDPGKIRLYASEFDSRTAKLGNNIITGAAIYWDPSSGKKSADNSVCVLVYRDDKNKLFFVHDAIYLMVPDTEEYPLAYQCHRVIDFAAKHKMHTICIETNGIGNALPEIMRNTVAQVGYGIQIRTITNSRKKEDRILDALEPILTTGRFYAHERITQTPIISEMLAWTPNGGAEHDDGIDAIAGAVSCTPTPVHSIGITLTQYIANTDFKL